jgi:hypothetical protein
MPRHADLADDQGIQVGVEQASHLGRHDDTTPGQAEDEGLPVVRKVVAQARRELDTGLGSIRPEGWSPLHALTLPRP